MPFALGRRPPTHAPALRLASILTGEIPEHPPIADYLDIGGWQMLGNDTYGCCVGVAWANNRRVLTRLAGTEHYPDLSDVLTLYKTQNPGFPAQDQGMVMQDALDYLRKNGGPDGAKPLAFAKVDHTNLDEVKAAIAIFGVLQVGVNVQAANMAEFGQHQPWDFHPGSPIQGGHAVLVGGYDSDGTGADIRFITWGQETGFTDDFWTHLVEEAWVVIWPEHLGTNQFLTGIDQTKLAKAFMRITGEDLPIPEPPRPEPTTPYGGADPVVTARITKAAARAHVETAAWLNRHFRSYFHVPRSQHEPQA